MKRDISQIEIEKPPSIGIAVPVIKFEASLAKKIAIPSKSCGFPYLLIGVLLKIFLSKSGIFVRAFSVSGVSIHPGRKQLT